MVNLRNLHVTTLCFISGHSCIKLFLDLLVRRRSSGLLLTSRRRTGGFLFLGRSSRLLGISRRSIGLLFSSRRRTTSGLLLLRRSSRLLLLGRSSGLLLLGRTSGFLLLGRGASRLLLLRGDLSVTYGNLRGFWLGILLGQVEIVVGLTDLAQVSSKSTEIAQANGGGVPGDEGCNSCCCVKGNAHL